MAAAANGLVRSWLQRCGSVLCVGDVSRKQTDHLGGAAPADNENGETKSLTKTTKTCM